MKKNDERSFQRIMSIDYLKSVAVILVILTHALSKEQRLKIGGPFWISMAVPIFMILSGFTNSLSADKHNMDSLKKFFKKEKLVSQFSRVLIPYLAIILLELLLGGVQRIVFETGPFELFKLKDFILFILTGGTTPGSYYIPILIQFILIFPFMLLSFKRFGQKSVVFFFTVHFFYDVLANYLPISVKIYRLLIFRYLVFIIMGIALYHSYDRISKSVRWSAIISLAYIGYYTYLSKMPKVFSKWPNTSLPTVFWALAIVIIGMTYLEKENTHYVTNVLSRIGQASYQIFLVQKLLFGFGLNRFYRMINLNNVLSSVFSILLCCFIGIVFHDIQLKIQMR